MIALLALVLAMPGFALIPEGQNLNANLLYYEPVPAAPGSLLDVYVQLENNGSQARKVTIAFVDNGPFVLDNEADRVRTTDSIPSQESFLVKYKVRVKQDAVPGTNYIKIDYGTEGSGNTRASLLPIDVYSSTVSLSIASVAIDPAILTPGTPGTVTLRLHNDANVKITSGVMELGLDDVDLIPLEGTNQQRFTDLLPGDTRSFSFTLAPSPSIVPGVYKIPVDIDYTDQQGRSHETSEYIGVRVGAVPDVSIVVDDISAGAANAELMLRVTNKGLGEIKFVTIQFDPTDSYSIPTGASERYVGNIDSDDYKTARMVISGKGKTDIPVTITYMDALNNKYTMQETLSVTIPEAGGKSNTSLYVVVAVIVIVVGIVWWRKRRARK
jgi:hypothetical protein